MLDKLINLQVLYSFLELESYVLISCLIVMAWLIYKFLLQSASEERHRNIRSHFQLLIKHYVFLTFIFSCFVLAQKALVDYPSMQTLIPYLGLVTFLSGMAIFVKTTRLMVLEYLFMGSMRTGVPLLLVNIYTLILSVILVFWSVSHVFGVQLAPLLATSAVFSIILGLALQDTLGNLFAGISLQIDKNFELGDWVEVTNGSQKIIGQIKEISWRSTLLVGFSEELITLPNRFMAQAQISNFSPPDQPIVRSHFFRLPHDAPLENCKEWLEQAAVEVPEVRGLPSPFAFVSDINESWINFKLIYFIDSYGTQYVIGDKVQRKGIEALNKRGIKLAHQQLELIQEDHAHNGNFDPQNP